MPIKTPTTHSIKRAYSQAVKHLQGTNCTASASSAGFIIPDGQKRGERKGFQVFVKVCRYDEALLKREPMTGGLLSEV